MAGTVNVSLQLWLASGFTSQPFATAFLRTKYAVIDDTEHVLTGGNRNTVTTTVNPFGVAGNVVHYVDQLLIPTDFTSNTTFVAFELERDVTDPNDTYTDILRICEMRFKYVSA